MTAAATGVRRRIRSGDGQSADSPIRNSQMVSQHSNPWLLTAALLGGLAVGCGAFGAHGLKAHFTADGEMSLANEQKLATWETAARYQMYHALALLAVGLLAARRPGHVLSLAGLFMTIGTVIFSG